MFEALLDITGAERIEDFQIASIDGDNEVGVLAGGINEWTLIVVNTEDREAGALINIEFDSLDAAIKAYIEYLHDEYQLEG